MTSTPPEDWRDWVGEARRIVEDWEAGTSQRLLMTSAAAALIVRIARGLHEAYARGRNDRDA